MTIGDALCFYAASRTQSLQGWKHDIHSTTKTNMDYPVTNIKKCKRLFPLINDASYQDLKDACILKCKWSLSNVQVEPNTLGYYDDAPKKVVDNLRSTVEFKSVVVCNDEDDMQEFEKFMACEYKIVTNPTSWIASWLSNSSTSHLIFPGEIMQPNPSVGCVYVCDQQPAALRVASRSFRNMYPEASFAIASLHNDYREYAKRMNAHYLPVIYHHPSLHKRDSLELAVQYVSQFLKSCSFIQEPYFMLCGDCVHIARPLRIDLSKCKGDILSIRVLYSEHTNTHYGAMPGSLFKTSFWQSIVNDKQLVSDVSEILSQHAFSNEIVLSLLCVKRGGNIEFMEDELSQSILHDFDLYLA